MGSFEPFPANPVPGLGSLLLGLGRIKLTAANAIIAQGFNQFNRCSLTSDFRSYLYIIHRKVSRNPSL